MKPEGSLFFSADVTDGRNVPFRRYASDPMSATSMPIGAGRRPDTSLSLPFVFLRGIKTMDAAMRWARRPYRGRNFPFLGQPIWICRLLSCYRRAAGGRRAAAVTSLLHRVLLGAGAHSFLDAYPKPRRHRMPNTTPRHTTHSKSVGIRVRIHTSRKDQA